MSSVPAILILDKNKTYGRSTNKKRLLYKCIPEWVMDHPILVPYEVPMGFLKSFTNRYVLISVGTPHGYITENIGEVNDYNSFVKYQMYCRKLWISIQTFSKYIYSHLHDVQDTDIVHAILRDPLYTITHYTAQPVITIDPIGCTDIDDGFSVNVLSEKRIQLNIHIANPVLLFESMGTDTWKQLTDRTTTVYLPHKKEPMLPTILSEQLCSLLEDTYRITFTLSVEIDSETGHICTTTELNYGYVHVYKNYAYESEECEKDPTYLILKQMAEMQSHRNMDSHDVVEHWMKIMNQECGKRLANQRKGIFRTAHFICPSSSPSPDTTPEVNMETKRAMVHWSTISGNYSLWEKDKLDHVGIGISEYVHITSPIRRIVDLVNQIAIMKDTPWSTGVYSFLEKYMSFEGIAEINRQHKESRKIEQECQDMLWASSDPSFHKTQEGIVIEIIDSDVVVYLSELKRTVHVKYRATAAMEHEITQYARYNFRAYYFEKEGKMRKKIRWCFVF